MLTITFPQTEEHGALTLHFEHSLVSLSKWETIHEKAFFGREPRTPEESISYIQQMLVEEVSTTVLTALFKNEHYQAITDYINTKASATWFREQPGSQRASETITTELVYYWMIQFQIPFIPCQDWHFNRLMTLIKIAGIKQSKPKRMSKAAQMEQYRQLNAERKQKLGTNG